MPDKAYITLHAPPAKGRKRARRKRVLVRTLTLGRFARLLTQAAATIAEYVAKAKDGRWNFWKWVQGWSPEDRLLLIALACPDERPSTLQPFATQRNVGRVLEAMAETNDAMRLVRAINLDPDAPRNGSIDADVVAVCRQFPGLTPPEVRAWSMGEFLDTCEALHAFDRIVGQGPEPEPRAPLSVLGMIPGMGVN